MRNKVIIGVLCAVGAAIWARSSSGQVQAVPGPGTGIVIVKGTVDVGNVPIVEAVQRGEWRVSLPGPADVRVTNAPPAALASHVFLRVGGRYDVTWPVGEKETVAVAQLGAGGWVRVDGPGRRRWLNLDLAKYIDEIP
jgi:hypothetical protein